MQLKQVAKLILEIERLSSHPKYFQTGVERIPARHKTAIPNKPKKRMVQLTTVTLAVATTLSAVQATTVYVKNSCDKPVDLYDNHAIQQIQPGGQATKEFGEGAHGMLRHGINPQATLAEFSITAGKPWFDISIIPTGGGGPGYCPSLEACKQVTGGTGFNLPMQIKPTTNLGRDTCQVLTCLADGCPDAYLFPKDDKKTHNCPVGTDFEVVFCPDGNGGATKPPPPPPTTQAPTTPPPTQPPTTSPPTTQPPPDTASPAKQRTGQAQADVVGNPVHNSSAPLADVVGKPVRSDSPASTSTGGVLGTAYQSSPTPGASTAPPATTKPSEAIANPVQEANTKSSNSGGTVVGVLLIGAGLCAVGAAVVFVVMVRRKKQQLDEEPKSPMMIIEDPEYLLTESPQAKNNTSP